MGISAGNERGAATVEHLGLVLLVVALIAGAVALVAATPAEDGGRGLGSTLGRKIRCGAVGPGPCWRDPLTVAYGRETAGLLRAWAPTPAAVADASGRRLWPIDFRHCRSPGCAAGGDGRLTGSNRRTTAFTHVVAASGNGAVLTYWLYRPGVGWESVVRRADSSDIAAHAKTPLLETDAPRLVPLETLDGRNHVKFAAAEEPPWRWRVESNHAVR